MFTSLAFSCCLLVVYVGHFASAGDDEFGCKLQDDWLKAVTVYNNRLYLIIAKKRPNTDSNVDPYLTQDWVYSLPFASTHIDSFGRRLRMFFGLKRESTNWQTENHFDPSVSWLQNLQDVYLKLKDAGISLSQLNLLLGATPNTLYIDIILMPSQQTEDVQYSMHYMLKHVKEKKQLVLDFGVPQEEYLVLGDGQRNGSNGFVMWLGPRSGVNESILATGLLVQEESNKLNIPAIPYHGNKPDAVQVNPNTRYYRLLVTKSISSQPYQLVKLDLIDGYTPKPLEQPRHRHWKSHQFGFLFDGIVHIWDIYRERVYLFQPKLDGSTSCMYEVLLNDYIACNDAEWAMKDVAQCPEESKPSNDAIPWKVLILMASAAAGLLLIVSLVGTALCYRRGGGGQLKQKKRRLSADQGGRGHDQSTSTSNPRAVRTPKTNFTHRSPDIRPMMGKKTKKSNTKELGKGVTPTEFLFPT